MRLAASTLALALLGGCYRTHFVTGVQPERPQAEIWHHNLAYGLLELNPTNLDQVCPGGIARVDHEMKPVDALLRYLIGGWLWQPSTITVWCIGPGGVGPGGPGNPLFNPPFNPPNQAPPSQAQPPPVAPPLSPPPLTVPPPPPPAAPS